MSFIDTTISVVESCPVTSGIGVIGVVSGVALLWKGGRAIFKGVTADIAHHRENERLVADLPRPARSPFEKRHQF